MRWLLLGFVACAAGPSPLDDKPVPKPPATELPVAPAPPIPAAPVFDRAPPADRVIAIGRDATFACAVHASGAIDCWGAHEPKRAPDWRVQRATGIADAVAIAGNGRCAIRRDRTVACLDPKAAGFAFVAVPGLAKVRALDPAGHCAIVEPATVACFDTLASPKPAITDAVSVATTRLLGCAVRANHRVTCFDDSETAPLVGLADVDELALVEHEGIDNFGCARRRGNVTCFLVMRMVDPPWTARAGDDYDVTDRTAFAGATQIALATDHRGAVELVALVGGRVVTSLMRDDHATTIATLADATQLAPGCALRATGGVACWGDNAGGVLGRSSSQGRTDAPPTPVVGVANAVSIALGWRTSYAVTRDGRVFGWGTRLSADDAGQPVPVDLGPEPHDVVEIATDPRGRLCVRGAAGEVWCQTRVDDVLGIDRVEAIDTPPATRIAVDFQGAVAMHADGRADRHPLSQWTDEPRYSVRELDRDPEIVYGAEAYCRIHAGALSCAGVDANTKRHAEVPVVAVPTARAVAVGPMGGCAVIAAGAVTCWRWDAHGLPTAPTTPIARDAIAVAIGQAEDDMLAPERADDDRRPQAGLYACAIMADRTVRCWGANLHGELGDGSLLHSAAPIGVAL